MQGYWRRSVYECVYVGLLFALVSCGGSDDSTITNEAGITSTNEAGITSFMIEHVVDVTTIQSTLTPSLPPEVVGPIFAGTKEVRSRIFYDQATGMLSNNLFLVDPGVPLPTPASVNFAQVRFAFIDARIDMVYSSFQPNPSAMFVGVITAGFPIFAPPAGAPYAFTFGYTSCTSGQFRDIVSLATGLAVVYHDHAPGTCTTS